MTVTPSSQSEPDVIRLERPAGLTDAQWREIAEETDWRMHNLLAALGVEP